MPTLRLLEVMAGLSTYQPFPFCIEETADASLVGNGTEYPAAFTYENLFKLYYRLYGVGFELLATVTADGGAINQQLPGYFENLPDGYPFLGTTEDNDGTIVTSDNPENETGMACDFSSSIGLIYVDVGDWAGMTLGLAVFGSVYLYDGLYYPRLVFTLTMSDGGDTFDFSTSDEFAIATMTSTLGIPFVESSIAIYLTSFSSYSDTDLTGDINVIPISYWPYDPGDGSGPIWDSASGAELRDPFSVQTWN